MFMSVSMDSEPSVNQDTDLEIEGGGADSESIDPGMVECMEVEEEEDVNGDVIRCLCNESEEGGFMIQVIILQPLELIFFKRTSSVDKTFFIRQKGESSCQKVSVKCLLHSETRKQGCKDFPLLRT